MTHHRIGRPRNKESYQAILNAALTLLKQNGYKVMTIEGIAREAGVGKQTIYRWWSSKAHVILEAFAQFAETEIEIPNQGDLYDDLTLFLSQTFQTLEDGSKHIVRALMAEAILDAEFQCLFREQFITKRRNSLQQIIQQAVERGELPETVDFTLIIDLLYGAMWYRLLNGHAPLDSAFARQLAYNILKLT